MAMTHIARIDRSIYLGGSEDPQPVFRDEAGDSATWPEGAAMAVTFTNERFGHLPEIRSEPLPHTDFFGLDGWPIDLPEGARHSLGSDMKREFQIYPWGWRAWQPRDWRDARDFPETFARSREGGAIARAIVTLTSILHT